MRVVAVVALVTMLAGAARADEVAEDRAHAHYEVGRGLYRLGDYRGALREFAAGYELVREPGFLLNIGQTYRKLGDPAHARQLYRQFLDEAPADHPARAQAERVLRELDEAVQNAPPPAAAAPALAPKNAPAASVSLAAPARADARPRRRALRIAGITLGVAGVALLGGGVGAAVDADDNARELNRLDQSGGRYDPGRYAAYTRDRTVEGVCFGLGGALAAAGIVLVSVSAR
ncbi:MAG TPA: hypothetical protein VFF06_30405 [Polyangia bacterium]|nr:hypothetical protein [Polyangia bacterium]